VDWSDEALELVNILLDVAMALALPLLAGATFDAPDRALFRYATFPSLMDLGLVKRVDLLRLPGT
jgi:hypothetical protein